MWQQDNSTTIISSPEILPRLEDSELPLEPSQQASESVLLRVTFSLQLSSLLQVPACDIKQKLRPIKKKIQ